MIYYIFYIILILLAVYCAIKISVADFSRRIIPDAYLFPLLLIGLCLIAFFPYPIELRDAVIGAIFGYITTTIIGITYDYTHRHKKNTYPPIGMGDIKLISIGGLWLGVYGLSIALIISCVCGAIWARINHAKYIPFGPFFLLGVFLSFFTNTFLL